MMGHLATPVAIVEAAPRRVVRLHPPIGLSLLFRPIGKSAARPKLDVRYRLSEDTCLRFSAREALGVPEQTLLLVLLELAAEQYAKRPLEMVMDGTDRSEVGRTLWESLHRQGGGLTGCGDSLRLSCTWRELNRRCGSGNGGALIQCRRESLRRLCEVVVWEEQASRRKTRQIALVVWMVGDDQRVHVALNHRLAAALMGGQYAQVLLSERFALRSDIAMAVHAFLSTCLRAGHTLRIAPPTLAGRLWPDADASVPDGTRRRRLGDVHRALQSIGGLPGWSVEWFGGNAHVKRQGTSVREMTQDAIVGDLEQPVPALVGARETTQPRREPDEGASWFGAAPGANPLPDKHLPRNDAAGLFITTL